MTHWLLAVQKSACFAAEAKLAFKTAVTFGYAATMPRIPAGMSHAFGLWFVVSKTEVTFGVRPPSAVPAISSSGA